MTLTMKKLKEMLKDAQETCFECDDDYYSIWIDDLAALIRQIEEMQEAMLKLFDPKAKSKETFKAIKSAMLEEG